MDVVVVESPAKAKTINKYLGPGYTVLASFGHIRDLPSKNGSVRPDDDFAMTWDMDQASKKRLKDIADALKGADRLVLATDPDREGEAISWHVLEVLTEKKALKAIPVSRVVFNAITKSAVTEAMQNPRDLDMELVEAYLARRALDYLVGFTLSPVLWRKLPGARSAGRVQSVALRLITQRELEIEAFVAREYWTLEAEATSAGSAPFMTRLVTLDGQKLDKFDLPDDAAAARAKALVAAATFKIDAVEAKPVKRNPAPPFTTSTLQQEAARKLGFSANQTMRIAQKLYEGVDVGGETVGLITYMRTDGVQMAMEAIHEARDVARARYGERYVPEKPRFYSTKAKNAQEAHEAIRPTSFARLPEKLRLDPEMAKLYALIWKRAAASQMASAELERTTIDLVSTDKAIGLRATGTVVIFDGYLALYQEGSDDADDEEGGRLPRVTPGAGADVAEPKTEQHFTQPPPRFSEASLVKKLEELGIGRPSTYASILTVLQEREYVALEQKRFVPSDKGRLVTAFLENFFSRYVQYDFTADLEDQLDQVSAGDLSWKALLRDFWTEFSAAADTAGELTRSNVLDAIDQALAPHIFPPKADGGDPRLCPTCGAGRLSLKLSKWGAFVGCSTYPECKHTRQLGESGDAGAAIDGELGVDPESGETVNLKSGRFGPYLQLGEGEKPKRSSLPKGWEPASLTLDQALQLLRLPRLVGLHPEDGAPIEAGLGKFGPFVKHDKTYANLASIEEVFEVGINRAVDLIAQKRAGGSRRGGANVAPLRVLGDHPETGKPVALFSGKFGPYVKHDKINATLPKAASPETITLEQALALIAEKAAKAPAKGKGRTAKSTTTKPAAASSAAKPKAKPQAKTKVKAKTGATSKAKPKAKSTRSDVREAAD